jgi:hypothetical protein
MDTKFRPIPITILDILAIFLPGFVWLILIATFFEVLKYLRGGEVPTPVLAWEHIIQSLKKAETWFAPFPLLVVSLLLGYLLKPGAIVITEQVATQWVVRQRYWKEIEESHRSKRRKRRKRHKKKSEPGPPPNPLAPGPAAHRLNSWLGRRPFKWFLRPHHDPAVQEFYTRFHRRLKFPFNGVFYGTPLYDVLHKTLKARLDCDPQPFPGRQIFATAKSYLKAVSPTMWEESERREAEVRMAGVMYLAFLLSSVLSFGVLLNELCFRGGLRGAMTLNVFGWFVVSAAGVAVTGESFSLLRVSEVGYTYLNALVAHRCGRDGEAPGRGL